MASSFVGDELQLQDHVAKTQDVAVPEIPGIADLADKHNVSFLVKFYMIDADVSAAAQSAGEGRPPGIAEHRALTESELAVSSGQAGSHRPGERDTPVAAAANAKSAGEAPTESKSTLLQKHPYLQCLLV